MNNQKTNTSNGGASRLPVAPQVESTAGASNPAIPLTVLDAPSQRLYAFGIYTILVAWKFYDWIKLVEDDTESVWLFMKWVGIDLVFLFGLPELRIPWLELSPPFTVALFFCHGIFDWMLMFNVGLPWQTWILGFMKLFYDSEMAISEHNVKVSNIIHNNSLIMGKYTVNILPEGSAVLNPDENPYCIGNDQKEVKIPMFFNSTIPYEVELIRIDLASNKEEIISLSRRQLREIERQAKKPGSGDEPEVVRFEYTAQKPGAYRLGKVLDKYKLEVQKKTPSTFVVPCPRAYIPSPHPVRCLGDLSDMAWQVEGTPPLKISYQRSINGQEASFHFQNLQPDGFASPLVTSSLSNSMIVSEDDVTWARSQVVMIPFNESMTVGGAWRYSVDEVVDGFGNVVKYTPKEDDIDLRSKSSLAAQKPIQSIDVKERPRVRLEGCDLRRPLKIAKGYEKELPVVFQTGRTEKDGEHSLIWHFSPIDTLTQSGDHGEVISVDDYKAQRASDRPKVSKPGLYTLKSVTSAYCEGEVQEPSSCLVLNPVEPELNIKSEKIPDLCAGNSIGLRVDLNLVGTPPFRIKYTEISNGQVKHKSVDITGMRDQLELIPHNAGHHKYKFTYIDDDVYKNRELKGPEYELEQKVKPAASARILGTKEKKTVCLEEKVQVGIHLQGEAPFTIEGEIIHENKGKISYIKHSGIETSEFTVETASLTRGGEYTIALTKIIDARGCPTALKEEQKIVVRRQRPRASFGVIENKRKATVVESAKVNIPVRLAGEGPWEITVRNVDKTDSQPFQTTLRSENDKLEVRDRGTYEIVDVRDRQCAGTVDSSASRFEVDWVPRPKLSLIPSDTITKMGEKYVKAPVCQGDLDGFEVGLKGTPPYLLEYSIWYKAGNGGSTAIRKSIDTMSSKAAVQMDTNKAGTCVYDFSALGDQLYDSDKQSKELVVEQVVNAKPSATFGKPGQTYKYCKSSTEGETIPISLTGVAPFALEVEIKHHSGSAETYQVVSIESSNYMLQVPTEKLKLGTQQVRIREVKDANGCVARTIADGPTVQVQQYDAPAIYPLETRSDYCVGERLSFALTGTPPFEVYYTFGGSERKAKSPTTSFRRVAESPGEFRITGVSDKASECRAAVDLVKNIHPMPAVKISKGKNVHVDIHEGGETEILFEFWGTPPFEFTYTRSTNPRKGQKSRVLETRHDVSHEQSKVIRASQEGTYEVVAIKDAYCAFSTQKTETTDKKQKLLQ